MNDPHLASLASGNVFVTWTGVTPDLASHLYGRVFNASGTAIGNEFGISQNARVDTTSIASLTDENVFVTWGSGQTSNDSIYGRIVSGQGLTPTPTPAPTPTSPVAPTPSTSSASRLPLIG